MTDQQPGSQDPATMDYEESRDELTSIVAQLEEGTASLDQSLTLWERGEALARRCTQWLDSAQARLDALEQSEPGQDNAGTDPQQAPGGATSPPPNEPGKPASPPW